MDLNRYKSALIGLAAGLILLAVVLLLARRDKTDPAEGLTSSTNAESGAQARRFAQNDDDDNSSQSRKSLRSAANKAPSKIVTTKSGLQYLILREGTGPRPALSDKVKVDYIGTFDDGTVFDESFKRGQPSVFPLTGVIMGWREGLQLMNVGSKFKLIIPPELAYGETDRPSIPGNSTLTFEVELLEIVE